ncbi:5-methylcytosine-specific restriction endonuclease system specificity protein McrC [Novosphingobium mangrovi (ex Hu et al. 2023)]|uniref:5-methylcytosine-specific restriction endonuclease system specificity protein McrC n=1 Tax=Novosphingobium mangrovi (ex Hu et al. 2023) TaxID=2930094 RepID=A0ABT0AFY0_9SPHN|nr:5-methylcytosine-specific restriction endonuclease system specificity protein McrC [Novosphingobium mangrovi (ex Hu et al. 2023)]MCJ1962075.1 5-methylcytosine-specific restriction endonuclease system specificity protein McrC [Novosphingobium mangrovi (ex Hu et al. 2023)]
MSDPRIPIANIYYMFCYAWDRFEQAKATDVGAEPSPDLPNLLARVLLAGVRNLIRRGLDRGYQPKVEELATVRGRIEIDASLSLQAQRIRRLACEFDELSHDVLHNRIIKASMLRLAGVRSLEPDLAHELRAASRTLRDVTDMRLTGADFARVQLHRNNAYYDFLLRVCRLAFDLMLPNADGNGFQFQDILRDERKMALVFESFVRNFYRTEQTAFRVSPLQLRWDAIPISRDQTIVLPQMRTDIFLSSPTRRIIIDTKYYRDALQERFGSKTFRSENLYQLFSYLKNAEAIGPEFAGVEGMLLYPAVNHRVDAQYQIQGHAVRIVTIDLDQEWPGIEEGLRSLLQPPPTAAAA